MPTPSRSHQFQPPAPPPAPPPPAKTASMGSNKRTNIGGTINSNTNVGLSKRLSDELSEMLESDDFSIGGYLNKSLAVEDGEGSIGDAADIKVERLMAKVALQLQLETQSCHDEIGRIGAELQAILPRCGADINRLAVGLDGMKDDTKSLVENFSPSAVNGGTSGASGTSGISVNMKGDGKAAVARETMDTLSTLHALQLNLKFTKSILEATSSWDSTMSSIPSLLSNQKMNEAVTALTHLQQGARALRGMPGKDQRQETIQKFKTQIETLLKPQLLHAFANIESRINLLHQSHHMYKQLGNLDNFVFEYVKNRPAALHKGWFAFTPTLASPEDTSAELGFVDSDQPKENSFISFLPHWYESILTLLNEERRRTQNVFGNQAAPYVTVKILAETFRPILASFQSRLSSIYSPNISTTYALDHDSSTLSYAGSLQTICDAYEATLQFLSLAHDHIVNTVGSETDVNPAMDIDHSLMDSSNVSENHIPHFQLTKQIYIDIASPFSSYQKQFAMLENQHSSLQLAKIAKDIHAAVRLSAGSTSAIISLSKLQESIDELERLTPMVFSIVEGAMTRFELLNCGYHSPETLSTIDKLLSNHTSELSIAISTLSASIISDEDLLADSFDEQHVLCALEVLKITGNYKQELKKFESSMRMKLRAQIPKIQAYQSPEFFNTDTVSPVDIATLLASAACCSEEGQVSAASTSTQLQRISGKSNGSSSNDVTPIISNAHDATTRLAHSCHTFVFDICTAVPKKYLRSLSAAPVWRETVSAASKALSGMMYDTPMSILPQSYVTQVGEHMLALVQALEPFASSPDALRMANQIMGDESMQVAVRPWREFIDATTLHSGKQMKLSNVDELVSILMNGKKMDISISPVWKQFDPKFPTSPIIEDEEDHEDEDEFEKASAAFCNEWLDVIGTAVTGRILERILRIHRLTDSGAKHLATDLNYLLNVFSALGILGHPHPLLKHFENLVSMEKDVLTERIILAQSIKNDSNSKANDLENLLWGAEERIASMRDALS